MNYEEHALTQGTSSKAIAYVCIKKENTVYWGAGIDEDIIKASIGYPNVEHFSRTFKKKYHMTPIQYRESKN